MRWPRHCWPAAATRWPPSPSSRPRSHRSSCACRACPRSIRRCGNWATSAGSRRGGSRVFPTAGAGLRPTPRCHAGPPCAPMPTHSTTPAGCRTTAAGPCPCPTPKPPARSLRGRCRPRCRCCPTRRRPTTRCTSSASRCCTRTCTTKRPSSLRRRWASTCPNRAGPPAAPAAARASSSPSTPARRCWATMGRASSSTTNARPTPSNCPPSASTAGCCAGTSSFHSSTAAQTATRAAGATPAGAGGRAGPGCRGYRP